MSVAATISDRQEQVETDGLHWDFPTVYDGARGVHFIEKTVESSRSDETWLDARWRAPEKQRQTSQAFTTGHASLHSSRCCYMDFVGRIFAVAQRELLASERARPGNGQRSRQYAYVLCRIEDDSSLTPVSRHEDMLTGLAAGGYAVEVEDSDFAYALYAGDPFEGSQAARVASFREGRIGYRLCAKRTGRMSTSVEDRYDHDIDELMA